MGNQIKIEGEEAYAMASELAGLTGESVDAAVVEAIRLRLEQEREKLFKDVKAISAEIRERLGPNLPSSDHSWLYDEDGLPK